MDEILSGLSLLQQDLLLLVRQRFEELEARRVSKAKQSKMMLSAKAGARLTHAAID